MFQLTDSHESLGIIFISLILFFFDVFPFIIIVIEQIKAAPETIKGKFFGPKGSAKKGDSNRVALTKNVSANIVKIEPNIRSDTISLHQVLWIKLGLLP